MFSNSRTAAYGKSMRVSASYDRPTRTRCPTRARRIAGMSFNAVAKASMSARRSSIDASGRSRNKTTWAINGAGPSETGLAVENDAAGIHAPADPVVELSVVSRAAVELGQAPRSVLVRGWGRAVAAVAWAPPSPARGSIACAATACDSTLF